MKEEEFAERVRAGGGRLFIVGGWVRDSLRGAVPKDKDYLISGLAEKDFQQMFPQAKKVGRSFPVYLLSVAGKSAEIAFARTERKTGHGYCGFTITADPAISVEEDLYRRDTTMNSIAVELPSHHLLDPFGGQQAIAQQQIQAVSQHFCEDPVRALRAARQAAVLGFSITEGTLSYMRQCREELREEPAERLQQELERALLADCPSVFFRYLQKAGLLETVFPEIAALIGRTQPVAFHPEGDAFVHSLQVLDETSMQTKNPAARFAALVHDLGKGTTPVAMEPHHYGHEARGIAELAKWNARGRLPKLWVQCASLVIREHMRAPLLAKPGKIVALLLLLHKALLPLPDFLAIIRADHGSLPGYLAHAEEILPMLLAVSGKEAPEDLQGQAVGVWIQSRQVQVYQHFVHTMGMPGK